VERSKLQLIGATILVMVSFTEPRIGFATGFSEPGIHMYVHTTPNIHTRTQSTIHTHNLILAPVHPAANVVPENVCASVQESGSCVCVSSNGGLRRPVRALEGRHPHLPLRDVLLCGRPPPEDIKKSSRSVGPGSWPCGSRVYAARRDRWAGGLGVHKRAGDRALLLRRVNCHKSVLSKIGLHLLPVFIENYPESVTKSII
jgi:hypothetical protein